MSRRLPPLGCAAFLSACLAVPAFAAEVTYGVAVRTDVRTRTPLPGDRGQYVTGDLELNPRGEITLGVDTSTFFLGYMPTLLWREPQVGGGRLLPLHRARLAFGSRWQRVTMLLSQDGAYGVADIGSLRLPDGSLPTSVAEVQTLGSVPYVRSLTLLNVETNPADRFTLGFSAGYSLSGSTEDSQALPLQYGPLASVRARVALTRTDGLTTTAQVSQATFVTGQEQLVAQLLETWDRQISRTLQLNLGAGVAFTREEVIAQQGIPGGYLDVLPVALATLSWREVLQGHPLRLDTSLRMAPFSDRFTANVYERVEARVAGEYRPAREWITTAAVGGALAVPLGFSLQRPEGASTADNLRLAQAGDRLVFAEGTVAWSVKTWLLLQASARVLWTEQPRRNMPGQVQAVGTLSVTVLEQDSVAW